MKLQHRLILTFSIMLVFMFLLTVFGLFFVNGLLFAAVVLICVSIFVSVKMSKDIHNDINQMGDALGAMADSVAEKNKAVTALENLDAMVYVIDFDYNLLYINRSFSEAYGVNKSNYLHKKCYSLTRELAQPCAFCRVPILRFTKDSEKDFFASQNFEYLRDDTLDKWVSGSTSIVRWIDNSKVYFCVLNDETLRKNNEDQMREAVLSAQEDSASKTALLFNMLHKIKTPASSVASFAELAANDSNMSTKTREYLRHITEDSLKIAKTITHISEMSEIEPGLVKLNNVPFDLHALLTHCRKIILPKALEKNIMLHFYIEPSIDMKLVGDPAKLHQAFINILSNAVKYTDDGTVKLSVFVKELIPGSISLCFEIKDSGTGMSTDQVMQISEPFSRLNQSAGLGLQITKNIIEAMGGVLSVNSISGVGSKFSFELVFKTLRTASDYESYPKAEMKALERPALKGEVLICEDNELNQNVLSYHLERLGLTTISAENGQEGLTLVKNRLKTQKPFDLIFMDINMPVMDGLKAASEIAELGVTTPIVAMTINALCEDMELYKLNGMQDCINKPFTTQDLWECLLKYFAPIRLELDNKDVAPLLKQLRTDFVKSNKFRYTQISEALSAGAIKQAYRLAHTLKVNAAQIGELKLQQAADIIEILLLEEKQLPTKTQMIALKTELDNVISRLQPLLEEAMTFPQNIAKALAGPDKSQARELLQRLEPLLKSGNPQCLELVEEIYSTIPANPEVKELIAKIEDFDFKSAFASLATLKEKWTV